MPPSLSLDTSQMPQASRISHSLKAFDWCGADGIFRVKLFFEKCLHIYSPDRVGRKTFFEPTGNLNGTGTKADSIGWKFLQAKVRVRAGRILATKLHNAFAIAQTKTWIYSSKRYSVESVQFEECVSMLNDEIVLSVDALFYFFCSSGHCLVFLGFVLGFVDSSWAFQAFPGLFIPQGITFCAFTDDIPGHPRHSSTRSQHIPGIHPRDPSTSQDIPGYLPAIPAVNPRSNKFLVCPSLIPQHPGTSWTPSHAQINPQGIPGKIPVIPGLSRVFPV